jgi:hypothetical protein
MDEEKRFFGLEKVKSIIEKEKPEREEINFVRNFLWEYNTKQEVDIVWSRLVHAYEEEARIKILKEEKEQIIQILQKIEKGEIKSRKEEEEEKEKKNRELVKKAIELLEILETKDESEGYYNSDADTWDVEPRIRVKIRHKKTQEIREYVIRNVFDFGKVVHKFWGYIHNGVKLKNADEKVKVEGNKLYTNYNFYADNKDLIKPNAKWNYEEKCWEFFNIEALQKIAAALEQPQGFEGCLDLWEEKWWVRNGKVKADEFDLLAVALLEYGAPKEFEVIRM